jgi:UDP-N-acetylmuramate--alanine ligase
MIMNIKKVYFVGIGGIGMSAIARYFNFNGAEVHGYDRTETDLTKELVAEGMHIHYEDDISKIPQNLDLVVFTPAIPKDHKELNYFKDNKFDLKKRAEVLGIISREKRCVAIGGTHGKTTTTTMTTHLMRSCGVDVTAFLGGISGNFKSNFIEGKSEWVVVEADEYDRSFHQLNPEIAIINAIDADHLDIYGTEEAVLESYSIFAMNLNPTGTLLLKHSAKGLKKTVKTLQNTGRKVLTFGIDKGDVCAKNIRVENGQMVFDISLPYLELKDLKLNFPGHHNIENATAATAAALLAGADPKKIKKALASFKGVKRRFEYLVRKPDCAYIDDYAHHPVELEAAIGAAKMLYPDRKVTGIFQPHLYSRTRDFAKEFAIALDKLDEVILLDIYPARELPIEGITSKTIFDLMQNKNKILVSKENLLKTLENRTLDIVMTMGAGDIDSFRTKIKKLMK